MEAGGFSEIFLRTSAETKVLGKQPKPHAPPAPMVPGYLRKPPLTNEEDISMA